MCADRGCHGSPTAPEAFRWTPWWVLPFAAAWLASSCCSSLTGFVAASIHGRVLPPYHGNEANRDHGALCNRVGDLALLQHHQILRLRGITHGNHHASAAFELREQRGRDFRRGRCYDDAIERGELRPSQISAAR